MGRLAASQPSASRRIWRIAVMVVVSTLAVLLVFAWWASQQGYVSWFGTACTDEGFVDPPPSYEDLISKYGMSPYCARQVRGETWF